MKHKPEPVVAIPAFVTPTAHQIGDRPMYLHHLKQGLSLPLDAGGSCDVWELDVPNDATCLSEWASRFRQTYCLDTDIDILRDGTGKSRGEYLLELVFPDKNVAPGPAVRAGDFTELLVSDFVEFMLGYWVPRGKYAEKGSRDESVKGVDIVGFKCPNAEQPRPTDELLAFEVKAQLSGGKYNDKLQAAVNDSGKDYLRAAETLAAMRRRMCLSGKSEQALVIRRFQDAVDRPYRLRSGAAAILSDDAFDTTAIRATTTAKHNNAENLQLIVVKGNGLMALAHALYQRAADEA